MRSITLVVLLFAASLNAGPVVFSKNPEYQGRARVMNLFPDKEVLAHVKPLLGGKFFMSCNHRIFDTRYDGIMDEEFFLYHPPSGKFIRVYPDPKDSSIRANSSSRTYDFADYEAAWISIGKINPKGGYSTLYSPLVKKMAWGEYDIVGFVLGAYDLTSRGQTLIVVRADVVLGSNSNPRFFISGAKTCYYK